MILVALKCRLLHHQFPLHTTDRKKYTEKPEEFILHFNDTVQRTKNRKRKFKSYKLSMKETTITETVFKISRHHNFVSMTESV